MTVLVKPVRYCPISGNNLMRMTRASFSRDCEMFQRIAKRPWTTSSSHFCRVGYCNICQGEKGSEITLVETFEEILQGDNVPEKLDKTSSETLQGDTIMARKETGTCHLCGQEKTLRKHFDAFVCASCQVVRICAKNHPDLMFKALSEAGVELPEESQVAEALQKQIEILERHLENEHEIAELNMNQCAVLAADLATARHRIADLEEKIDTLHESYAVQESSPVCGPGLSQQFIDDLSGRLAVSMLLDKRPLITVDDIMMLRGEKAPVGQ